MSIGQRSILSFLILMLLLFCPSITIAKTNVSITRAKDFDPSSIKEVAVVVVECHEVVDCHRVEREDADALMASTELEVLPPQTIRELLFAEGAVSYSKENRALLIEKFDLDAIVELAIPFAERGDGFGGERRSSVKVEMAIVSPEGAILLRGVGTRRPKNVVSGPERVIGKTIKQLGKRAFEE